MTDRYKYFGLMITLILIITACTSQAKTVQPTKPPEPSPNAQTLAPTVAAATPAAYPAPTQSGPGSIFPTDYPAPVQIVPPLTNTGYPAPGTFKLIMPDASENTMAVDALNLLPKVKVAFDGSELEVLALVDVIKQTGIEEYNKITTVGSENKKLTLTRDQVAQAYLNLLPDGTVSLMVQGMPQKDWIAGIITMQIE